MTCFVKKEITQLARDGRDFLATVNFSFIRRFLNLMCKTMAMDITHVRGELQCIRKVLDSILWVRASVSPEHFHIPENSIEIMNTRSRPGLAVALGIFLCSVEKISNVRNPTELFKSSINEGHWLTEAFDMKINYDQIVRRGLFLIALMNILNEIFVASVFRFKVNSFA